MDFLHQYKSRLGVMATVFATFLVFFGFISVAGAQSQCVFDNLAEIPLDTQEQPAPGNLMFLLDDSGSMDWSMMMDDEHGDNSGLYHGYGYVF
ncbi:MAG: hypothetical protein R6X08_06830, partial [Desulfosalsimonadaceae bacterium]